MIANEVYNELKTRKKNKSFSVLLHELLHPKTMKKGKGLRECLGTLKKDKETIATEKTLKRSWKSWSKKYV